MRKKITYLFLASLFIPSVTFAQEFAYTHLKSAAEKVGLAQLDTLRGDTIIAVDKEMGRVCLRMKSGVVEHIGLRLFAEELKTMSPSPVYDYLEYAWLNHKCKIEDNPFMFQAIKFEGGNWDTLAKITDETPVSLSKVNDAYYSVEWTMAGDKPFTVLFPIGYENLMMSNREEIENNFIKNLQSPVKSDAKQERTAPDKSLMLTSDSVAWTLPGETYILSEISTATYYMSDSVGAIHPVYNAEYPAESMANLICGAVIDEKATIEVTFNKYGNVTETIVVPVLQFLQHCNEKGNKVYWGTEKVDDKMLTGAMFVYNSDYGIDHIFKMECPIESIASDDMKIISTASLFVPTTNVSNLFQKAEPKKKKIAWK